jgi:hypothetical protein
MKSMCVAVSTALPVLLAVIAVLTSFWTNDAPFARTVPPVPPAVRTALCVRLACANAASLTLAAPCVARMSTVVTVPSRAADRDGFAADHPVLVGGDRREHRDAGVDLRDGEAEARADQIALGPDVGPVTRPLGPTSPRKKIAECHDCATPWPAVTRAERAGRIDVSGAVADGGAGGLDVVLDACGRA